MEFNSHMIILFRAGEFLSDSPKTIIPLKTTVQRFTDRSVRIGLPMKKVCVFFDLNLNLAYDSVPLLNGLLLLSGVQSTNWIFIVDDIQTKLQLKVWFLS